MIELYVELERICVCSSVYIYGGTGGNAHSKKKKEKETLGWEQGKKKRLVKDGGECEEN